MARDITTTNMINFTQQSSQELQVLQRTCAVLQDCVVPTGPANVLCRSQAPRPAIVTSPADTSETAVLTMFNSAGRKVDINLINYNIKLNLTICSVSLGNRIGFLQLFTKNRVSFSRVG